MQETKKISLFPRQQLAMAYLLDDETNEIMFGWWARWGKTWLWCNWIVAMCKAYRGSQFLIWRDELKRLKQTTYLTLLWVLKDHWLKKWVHWEYNGQLDIITFKNWSDWSFEWWSKIFLVDLWRKPTDPEYDRLGSFDLTWCFIEEAQEIKHQAYDTLKWRFSKTKWDWWATIPKMFITCNPGKNWVYTEFYKKQKDWVLEKNKIFIPSLVTDNPFVPQSYIDMLWTASEVKKQRLLYGNFEYDDTPWRLMTYDKITDLYTNPKYNGDKYISWDIAREGKDYTIIGIWDWLELIDYVKMHKSKTTQSSQKIQEKAQQYWIWMSSTIIDEDWVGWWVVDQTKCKWFINNSRCIQPREAKHDETKKVNYQNLKTQCYFLLAKLVNENKINLSILSPEDQALLNQELDAIVEIDIDKDWPKKIIQKKDIKEKIWRSPDIADMIMMRMYFELEENQDAFFFGF